MADITIHKVNEARAFIEASDRIITELNNYFSVYANNYRFSPKFRNGFWDGKIRYMRSDNTIPIGLVERAKQFASIGNYSIKINFSDKLEITPEEFKRFADSLNITDSEGKPMQLRAYQLQSAFDACKNKHLSIELPTASGKSAGMYLIIRFLLHIEKKVLIIVPRTQLVEQLQKDFIDYGWNDAKDHMHLIYGGQRKFFSSPIILSTWQSLLPIVKQIGSGDDNLFEVFDAIFCDEHHSAKGASISAIGEKCVNAEFRLGCSGTYPEEGSADWHSIVGAFGTIKKYSTYKKLQEDGHIAQLKIFAVKLAYQKEYRKILLRTTQGDFMKENDVLIQNEERTKIITNLVGKTKGNTVVLFTKIEKHGHPLLESFKKHLHNKKILYVDGSVSMEERERVREFTEKNDDVVILGSYGVFSEGLNVKRIHNVVFASSYKSKIKVLQSLGRGLRKLGTKVLKLFDIIDNATTKTSDGGTYVNHSMRHYKERKTLYKKQGFDVKEVTVDVDFKEVPKKEKLILD